MKKLLLPLLSIALLATSCNTAQDVVKQNASTINTSKTSTYWQQHVDYDMEIDMDVNSFQYKGKQTLVYTNNSPDVLNKVY